MGGQWWCPFPPAYPLLCPSDRWAPRCVPPTLRVPSPRTCLPTLADAVAARRAAQLETRLAAAVPGPLHLRAAGRATEGGVVGLALGGGCGEKTTQGRPSVPQTSGKAGSLKESSLCRRRKREGATKPPRGRPTPRTAHALLRGQAEGEGRRNRLFVQKGVAHTQCPQPSPSRHRSSHPLLEGSFVLYSFSFLCFSFCLFLNQEQKSTF